jgi:hypothetical protein
MFFIFQTTAESLLLRDLKDSYYDRGMVKKVLTECKIFIFLILITNGNRNLTERMKDDLSYMQQK